MSTYRQGLNICRKLQEMSLIAGSLLTKDNIFEIVQAYFEKCADELTSIETECFSIMPRRTDASSIRIK